MALNDGFNYNVPKPFDPNKCSKKNLKDHLIQTSFFAAMASRLGLEGCEEVACMAMRHMLFTYSYLYEKLPTWKSHLMAEIFPKRCCTL